jgi:hypothetical protein
MSNISTFLFGNVNEEGKLDNSELDKVKLFRYQIVDLVTQKLFRKSLSRWLWRLRMKKLEDFLDQSFQEI